MAIINRNAVQFVYRFCVNIFFSLLDEILRSGLLEYVVSIGVLYKKLSKYVFPSGWVIFPPTVSGEFRSSVILASICYYIRHSNRYVVLAYCGLNLHLLNDDHLFHMHICLAYILLGEVSKYFAHS